MPNRLERGMRSLLRPQTDAPAQTHRVIRNTVTADGVYIPRINTSGDAAMRLSAVYRCVEVLSGDLAKLPAYVYDTRSRKRVEEHPLGYLLNLRPNHLQSAMDARYLGEAGRLCGGNGYLLIRRDPKSFKPVELIGLPYQNVTLQLTADGELYYEVIHPFTGEALQKVPRMNIIHVKNGGRNGYAGISVLEMARDVIQGSMAAQEFNTAYYLSGGQPSGVLETDADMSGDYVEVDEEGNETRTNLKDWMRAEWNKRHGGPENAHQVAILDRGLKYHPITISQADAQFVENSELSIRDLARFFGVPLYKLGEGKQSYNSNEQNAIEYVTGTLQKNVTEWEQELTYKLLSPQDVAKGLVIRLDMMAELRGDSESRAGWYRAMREMGVYSVNDIRAQEDLENVEGGDTRYASLNYVPLGRFDELSLARNQKGVRNDEDPV